MSSTAGQESIHPQSALKPPPGDIELTYRRPAKIGQDAQVVEESHVVPSSSQYLSGWKLYMLILGLCISLLLSTLETTIVSTSLVSITNALQGFENRDWIVTSYLLTYTGFLVIYAKFSDIFGAKFMILLALLIFTIFSIACGLASGMTMLIIFRAFQGLGGSGIYSMTGVVVATVVPPSDYGKYMAIISSVFAMSSVLGPLLGGVINERSTWRWVFLLNPPPAAVATALIIFFLPSSFSSADQNLWIRVRRRFTRASFQRLDLIGAALMLAASILFVYALEEAGTRHPWKSAVIIIPLVVAIVCWIAFIQYEIFLEARKRVQEPIFPMRLLKDRMLIGMLLNAFFAGFPFSTLVVNIPQRFQVVNNSSPSQAGILLLPLLLCTPLASAVSGYMAGNLRVPPIYPIVGGSVLQFLGVGLMCSLNPDSPNIQKQQYAFEILLGLGFGLVLTSLLGLIPLVVTKAEMPIIIGAVTQVRVLGGTIGLAIGTTVLNAYVKSELRKGLSEMELLEVGLSLGNISGLGEEKERFVRGVFGRGYAKQMWVLLGFSGLVLISSLIMWEREPRRFEAEQERDGDSNALG